MAKSTGEVGQRRDQFAVTHHPELPVLLDVCVPPQMPDCFDEFRRRPRRSVVVRDLSTRSDTGGRHERHTGADRPHQDACPVRSTQPVQHGRILDHRVRVTSGHEQHAEAGWVDLVERPVGHHPQPRLVAQLLDLVGNELDPHVPIGQPCCDLSHLGDRAAVVQQHRCGHGLPLHRPILTAPHDAKLETFDRPPVDRPQVHTRLAPPRVCFLHRRSPRRCTRRRDASDAAGLGLRAPANGARRTHPSESQRATTDECTATSTRRLFTEAPDRCPFVPTPADRAARGFSPEHRRIHGSRLAVTTSPIGTHI